MLRLHLTLQAVFHRVIQRMKGHVIGIDAYPDRLPSSKLDFIVTMLREAADATDAPDELKRALRKDSEFISNVIRLVSPQFCVFKLC